MGSNLDPQFTRHVDALFPRPGLQELLDGAEAARALRDAPGWPVLVALLNAETDQIDAELDDGRLLESRAHYAAKHGRRGGLKAPERAIEALIGRAESRLAEQQARHEGDAESSPDRSI